MGVVAGASCRLAEGLADGFAFAPFLDPSKKLSTIPFDFIPDPSDFKPEDAYIPDSTPREAHRHEVEEIIRSIAGNDGKTVAARAIRIEMQPDLQATFLALCDAYPDAFVFMFSTPMSGTWIGASPELLLLSEGTSISTMALAGTKPALNGGAWDEKNILEQRLVADFITATLSDFCEDGSVEEGATYTKEAGPVAHICTPISARINPDRQPLESLAAALSPTPAVCGSDRETSLKLISELESFPREYYAGFCGPSRKGGATALYVMLRSAKVSPKAVCVYAGGGITSRSTPESEWEETEIKSKTIINKLKHKQE